MSYPHFVVHVPHSSLYIPDKYREGILISDAALRRDQYRMTDGFCDELFSGVAEEKCLIVSPISRLACDVERFRDDAQEPMARLGMGLMYTRTVFQRRLRRYDEALRIRAHSGGAAGKLHRHRGVAGQGARSAATRFAVENGAFVCKQS